MRQGQGWTYFVVERPVQPLVAHVVRIDRRDPTLALHATLGAGSTLGMATVSDQVRALPPELGTPIAALNGDYGDDTPLDGPLGLHIQDRELVRGPQPGRDSFWVDETGGLHLESMAADSWVTWPDASRSPLRLNRLPEARSPAERREPALTLLSPAVGPRLALPEKRFAALQLTGGRLLGGDNRVVVRRVERGATPPAPGELLLELPDERQLAEGEALGLTLASASLAHAVTGLGSGPTLVAGRLPRRFASPVRHPRAAIGWNEEAVFLVAVDGRSVRTSMGSTLTELAQLLAGLGCETAMNLDGGGSTTLWLEGAVVSHPSEKGGERPSPNALVLLRRR